MSKIKVGVIGAGSMGKNHIRVYKELSNECELVGFHDIDKENSSKIVCQYSVNYFEKLDELLKSVDAVSIAAPTHLHKEQGVLCARNKKHILMEKPIAQKPEEAMEIIRICEENGVILQVGHIERFNPAIIELSNILKNQEIISLDFQRLSPYDKRISDTDVVKDLMIHDLDIMNSIVKSEISTLFAHGRCVFCEKDIDYAQALIKFNSNTLVSITSSRVTEDKVRTLCINTKNACIYIDYINRSIKISRRTNFKLDTGHDIAYKQENIIEKVYVQPNEPLKAELLSFLNCIQYKQKPLVDGLEGLKALTIADKISDVIYSQNKEVNNNIYELC